ncbi:MAG: M20 family peptidase [Candidimonas sp.]|nr:MAG: M20 family peptidase [Candidimonas sp.]
MKSEWNESGSGFSLPEESLCGTAVKRDVNQVVNPRTALRAAIEDTAGDVVAIASRLVSAVSENPPGDTGAIAHAIVDVLRPVANVDVEVIESEAPVANVVARLNGRGPGRRLVFNGHLDTFPAGDRAQWESDPFTLAERHGKLYGRGISDMKGGVACAIYAMKTLAGWRNDWSGELVLTFAGDEESMGRLGTQYLLDHVPFAVGDAMVCGDAGSPRVLRFGEKGMVWMEVTAHGHASHGAHVHLGDNAIELLVEALRKLTSLRDMPVDTPNDASAAMQAAARVSEALSGKGESDVLRRVTVNVGTIEGGTSTNLVPDVARASLDIRIPLGVTVAQLEAEIAKLLTPMHGIDYRITNRYEPSYTDPDHEIITTTRDVCEEIIGERPVVNMRVGASDSRLYRYRGVPTVVCGLTPHAMGGANEHVMADELNALAKIFVLTAFDFLQRTT